MLWWLKAVIPRLHLEEVIPDKSLARLRLIKKATQPARSHSQATATQVAELIALVSQQDPALALFIHFLAVTGLRIGGALSLRWENIDWEKGIMQAVVSKGRCLSIPMLVEAGEILKEFSETNPLRKRKGTTHCWPLGSTLKKKVNKLLK